MYHRMLLRSTSYLCLIQCQHLIPALNAWAARAEYTTAHPIATQFPGHGCMYDLTTERSFDSQAMWVINVFDFLFDMIYMGVCTTRHWQMSGRLVQELNVCTLGTCISLTVNTSSCFNHQAAKPVNGETSPALTVDVFIH